MDGYVGSWTFVAEYCLYVIIAVIGLIQLIAARWKVAGIAFFRARAYGYVFGTVLIAGAFIWFFGFTGLDLTQPTFDTPPQLLWLSVSVATAFVSTLVVASLINRKLGHEGETDDSADDGIEALRHKTYWMAVTRYFRVTRR